MRSIMVCGRLILAQGCHFDPSGEPWSASSDARVETDSMPGAVIDSSPNAVIDSAPGPTTVFYPTDDTFVNLSQPDSNKGAMDMVRINSLDAGDPKHSFLRFDVSSAPAAASSAILKMVVFEQTCTGVILEIADDSWTEQTLVPDNAPTFGAEIVRTTFDIGTIAVDVTDHVNTERASDGVISIGIRSDGPRSDVSIHSKESSDSMLWPHLEVTE